MLWHIVLILWIVPMYLKKTIAILNLDVDIKNSYDE